MAGDKGDRRRKEEMEANRENETKKERKANLEKLLDRTKKHFSYNKIRKKGERKK